MATHKGGRDCLERVYKYVNGISQNLQSVSEPLLTMPSNSVLVPTDCG